MGRDETGGFGCGRQGPDTEGDMGVESVVRRLSAVGRHPVQVGCAGWFVIRHERCQCGVPRVEPAQGVHEVPVQPYECRGGTHLPRGGRPAVTDVRRLERESREIAGQVTDRTTHRCEMRCVYELLREGDVGQMGVVEPKAVGWTGEHHVETRERLPEGGRDQDRHIDGENRGWRHGGGAFCPRYGSRCQSRKVQIRFHESRWALLSMRR